MKAIVYTQYGGPEVLQIQDIGKPTPGENEVVIKVYATTVAAADVRMRKADPFLVRLFNGLLRPTKIRTLGLELAGRIEVVGANVKDYKVGDEVFGTPGFRFGAHAEYVSVPVTAALAFKPANLTFEEAATIPVGASTALFFLKEKGRIRKGQNVLIYGASGSVGSYAVQIARHFGAHVTAVCSTHNIEMVKALYADNVQDYSNGNLADCNAQFDLIFDAVGKLPSSLRRRMLKPCGRSVSVTKGDALRHPLNLSFLKELVEAGKLKPVIDRVYPFERVADAHAYVDTGHKRGNVAIQLVDKEVL